MFILIMRNGNEINSVDFATAESLQEVVNFYKESMPNDSSIEIRTINDETNFEFMTIEELIDNSESYDLIESVATYKVELIDADDSVLMFAEGFEIAYDAYMYADDAFEAMHSLPTGSLFYIKSCVVWLIVNSHKVKKMWSFN